MGIPLSFIQVLFSVICILFSVTFTAHYFNGAFHWMNVVIGLLGGCILTGLIFGIHVIFRQFNLRSFNTAI